MNPLKTKLSQLREFMAAGDWPAALRLANSFGDLGQQKDAIQRAYSAMTRPDFYREIGRDPAALEAAGRAALIARYGDPADGFKNGDFK